MFSSKPILITVNPSPRVRDAKGVDIRGFYLINETTHFLRKWWWGNMSEIFLQISSSQFLHQIFRISLLDGNCWGKLILKYATFWVFVVKMRHFTNWGPFMFLEVFCSGLNLWCKHFKSKIVIILLKFTHNHKNENIEYIGGNKKLFIVASVLNCFRWATNG